MLLDTSVEVSAHSQDSVRAPLTWTAVMKLWSMSGPSQVFRKYRLLWTISSCRFLSFSSLPQALKVSGWTSSRTSQIQGSCWQCGQEPSPQVYCWRMKPESMKLLCNWKQSAPQSPDRLCWPMTRWNTGSKPLEWSSSSVNSSPFFFQTSICHLSPAHDLIASRCQGCDNYNQVLESAKVPTWAAVQS